MKRRSGMALTALAAGFVVTFSAGSARAGTVDCDEACQAQWTTQRQNALPRTGFYDTSHLQAAPEGTLIRQQPTTEYRVQGAPTAATRILYHSRTSQGRDVAASGVLLTPAGTPPRTGWPVVVDAHGTSGMARDCAPSLMRDLYHGDQMLRFLHQGWAVVAPDYAGMGTTGRPEFLNKTGEADDVIGAVRAARHAQHGLSSRWVLWGHSQGGGAALGVAEQQKRHPDPGYLGAVVTSPAADLTAIINRLATTPGLGAFLPMVAKGASFSDPRIKPGRILTDEAMHRLPVTGSGCLGVVSAVYGDLTGPTLVRPNALDDPRLARYLTANTSGDSPVGGPLFLLQGEADSVIPQAATDQVAGDLCRAGVRLSYRTYPGLAHDTYPGQVTGIDDGAMPDILTWIGDRFIGKPAPSTCH